MITILVVIMITIRRSSSTSARVLAPLPLDVASDSEVRRACLLCVASSQWHVLAAPLLRRAVDLRMNLSSEFNIAPAHPILPSTCQ